MMKDMERGRGQRWTARPAASSRRGAGAGDEGCGRGHHQGVRMGQAMEDATVGIVEEQGRGH